MIVWLFLVLIVIFFLTLLAVDWNSDDKIKLDEMWMWEDDSEEADEV